MSVEINFNQCVDLAVNPSLGIINTSLLHNLLHIIINQLQLSSSLIEFHGAGSASIENHIVNNHQHCGFEINEFEIEEDVDESTGKTLKKRREIKRQNEKIDSTSTKLFAVRNVQNDSQYPMGYPLSPIQALSIEQMQEIQKNSIHDLLANVMPSDEKFINAENSENPLKSMFDYINVSKRLDALEMGIRQMGGMLKEIKCKEIANQTGFVGENGEIVRSNIDIAVKNDTVDKTEKIEEDDVEENNGKYVSEDKTKTKTQENENSDNQEVSENKEENKENNKKDITENKDKNMDKNEISNKMETEGKIEALNKTETLIIEEKNVTREKKEKEIDPLVQSLTAKVNELSEQMKNFQCRCTETNFDDNLLKLFSGKLSGEFTSKTEMDELGISLRTAIEELQHEMSQFQIEVCQRLDSFKNDLIKSMKEIQDMLDTKVDKYSVPELKNYLENMIRSLDEKIENVDCKRALAAGAAKKIFKDINCVSCGERVIQADTPNHKQSMLTRNDEIHLRHNNINDIQLLKSLPTRLCGGIHTVTTPKERIFRSEAVKIKCHVKSAAESEDTDKQKNRTLNVAEKR